LGHDLAIIILIIAWCHGIDRRAANIDGGFGGGANRAHGDIGHEGGGAEGKTAIKQRRCDEQEKQGAKLTHGKFSVELRAASPPAIAEV
jgi:hypothetical protein